MDIITDVKVYKSGINGDTHYFITVDNKKIFSTFDPKVKSKKGAKKKSEEEIELDDLEHLTKIKVYLLNDLPDIAEKLFLSQQPGFPYPDELRGMGSTSRTKLLEMISIEFSK